VHAVGTYQAGDLVAAREHGQRSADAFRQAGDLRFVAALSTILGSVCMRTGDYGRAAVIYGESATVSERMRLTHVVASARCFQAAALFQLGPEAEAQLDDLLADTIATAHAIGDPRTENTARTFLALLHLRRGDLASADRESSQAIAAEMPHPSYRALTLDGRARVQLALGLSSDAASSAREAYLAVVQEGELADHGVLVRVTLAEALLASGAAAEARRVIAEAQVVVESVAARITDDEMRTSFLERVPANVRARELAEAWSSTSEPEEK
jgi:hypothetical protein